MVRLHVNAEKMLWERTLQINENFIHVFLDFLREELYVWNNQIKKKAEVAEKDDAS